MKHTEPDTTEHWALYATKGARVVLIHVLDHRVECEELAQTDRAIRLLHSEGWHILIRQVSVVPSAVETRETDERSLLA